VKKQNREIDILFTNAGVAKLARLVNVTEKFLDFHFNANIRGLFFTVQKALPLMKNGGSMLLNSSVVGVMGLPGHTFKGERDEQVNR